MVDSNSLDYPQHSGFDPFPSSLPPYIGAILFETFLYGLYTILTVICLIVILPRMRKINWLLMFTALIMFVIATADIGYTYYLVFAKLLKGGVSFENIRPKYWLYVTNNVIADSLLLYRCYVVWDHRKAVFIGPVLLLVGGTVCGYMFEGSTTALFSKAWIYLVCTVALNVILTALAAGRIFWLSRKAKPILDPGILQRYSGTIGILIESGSIYTLYVALTLAFHFNNIGKLILDAGLIQVVGMMPTLIIAQVGLGRAIHDAEANTRMSQSRIQIQSPRSGYNRSLPERADSFTQEPRRVSRISSRREEMRQHGYGRCACGECSASSQTFIMRDYHHHQPKVPSAELQRLPTFQSDSYQPESPLQGLGIRPLPLPDSEQTGYALGFDSDNSFEMPEIPPGPAEWTIYSPSDFVDVESPELQHVELGIAR